MRADNWAGSPERTARSKPAGATNISKETIIAFALLYTTELPLLTFFSLCVTDKKREWGKKGGKVCLENLTRPAPAQTRLKLDLGDLTYKFCGVWYVFWRRWKSTFSVFPAPVGGCKFWVSWRFRNISIAWLTSAFFLFLDHLKSPHSRMMDEVIKLERRQNESRGVYFWEAIFYLQNSEKAGGQMFLICDFL